MLYEHQDFQSGHHACAEGLNNCQSGEGRIMLVNWCANPPALFDYTEPLLRTKCCGIVTDLPAYCLTGNRESILDSDASFKMHDHQAPQCVCARAFRKSDPLRLELGASLSIYTVSLFASDFHGKLSLPRFWIQTCSTDS